jgi:hypothetical protein
MELEQPSLFGVSTWPSRSQSSFVRDLDQTHGRDLPKELQQFSEFKGDWQDLWLDRLVENAKGHRIRVDDFKTLSRTHSGFATLDRATGDWKMRIAVHEGLNGPSRFGVLCHELAHILLGHLGTDRDHWWPGRSNLVARFNNYERN